MPPAQGNTCASCWVNSAVAAVESALSITYNITPVTYKFSRQVGELGFNMLLPPYSPSHFIINNIIITTNKQYY